MSKLELPKDIIRGQGNCGLVALAIAAGVSLSEATAAYIRRDGAKRANWKGSTRFSQTRRVLSDLHVDYMEVTPSRRMTLKTWNRLAASKNRTYFIRTTGHVQVVRNGLMIDQLGPRDIESTRCGNKIVKDVLAIIEPRW